MIRPIDKISKSSTHQTGRAMDVKTTHLLDEEINKILHFLKVYDQNHNVGAISSTTGSSRLGYYHIGTGPHVHIQTRR